jgi:hypothetical protein
MNADGVVDMLQNVLNEQKETNRLLEKLVKMSAIFYEAMAERMYRVDDEPVLNVSVVSRYREDD